MANRVGVQRQHLTGEMRKAGLAPAFSETRRNRHTAKLLKLPLLILDSRLSTEPGQHKIQRTTCRAYYNTVWAAGRGSSYYTPWWQNSCSVSAMHHPATAVRLRQTFFLERFWDCIPYGIAYMG